MKCFRCNERICICRDGITLYCGDCLEILPLLEFDDDVLVLADPPYGINHSTDYGTRGRGCFVSATDYRRVIGDDKEFDPDHLFRFSNLILWGANYYVSKLPDSSSWLIWDKRTRNDKGTNDQADGEMAWSNCTKGIRIFRHMWNGCWRDSEKGTKFHPTQKPVALMKWCLDLKWVKSIPFILDPYAGSGSVLLAAKQMGKHAIGIEIDKDYCNLICARLGKAKIKSKSGFGLGVN